MHACNGRCAGFLSTLSLRRATGSRVKFYPASANFYPRSPCGERPDKTDCKKCMHHISIHALLAESDELHGAAANGSGDISIHALLAESDQTPMGERISIAKSISIHALLAESDSTLLSKPRSPLLFLSTLSLRRATAWSRPHRWACCDFYPRSPCGERLSSS